MKSSQLANTSQNQYFNDQYLFVGNEWNRDVSLKHFDVLTREWIETTFSNILFAISKLKENVKHYWLKIKRRNNNKTTEYNIVICNQKYQEIKYKNQ